MIKVYKSKVQMKCKTCKGTIPRATICVRFESGFGMSKQTGNICLKCLARQLTHEDITTITTEKEIHDADTYVEENDKNASKINDS